MIRVHFASYSVSFVEYAPKLKNGLYQDQPDGRALYSDDIGYNEVGLVWHSCWKFPIFPVNGFTDTSRGQWSGRNGIVHSNFTQHATCAKLSCVSVCSRLLSTVFWSYKARHYYCHIALPTRYTAPYRLNIIIRGARKVADLKLADLKLADLKVADQSLTFWRYEVTRDDSRSTHLKTNTLQSYSFCSLTLTSFYCRLIWWKSTRVERRCMCSYVRLMHRRCARRCYAVWTRDYFSKYRRRPHVNSGEDSDQRQLVQSVLSTNCSNT